MEQQTESLSASLTTYAACPNCLKLNRIQIERARMARPTCGACQATIDAKGPIINVSTRQLQALTAKSPLPVIVDFWAPWCGPCRAFAPTFEQCAEDSAGRAVFVKLNTQNNMTAGEAFEIRGIPTLIAFNNGKELDRFAGALPHNQFKNWLTQFVR